MASVFLSYDRDDSHRARHFARALEHAGHEVWWDLHVRGGAQFSKVIEEALKAADAVVVLWSTNSIDSAWVRDEAAAGRDSGRLVPIAIDGTEPPLGFRQFQTIDLSRWSGRGKPEGLRIFLADVEAMAKPSTKSEAPAETAAPKASRPLPKWLWTAAAAVIAAMIAATIAALVLWQPWRPRHHAPLVAVVPAATDTASNPLAADLLIKLGVLQSSHADALQLVEPSSRQAPDFTIKVASSDKGDQASLMLLDSRADTLLWTREFTAPSGKEADLRQQMAYSAAQVLDCAVEALEANSEGSIKLPTLKLYLSGCADMSNLLAQDPRVAASIFGRVVKQAPDFTGGWKKLLLTDIQAMRNVFGTDQLLRRTLQRHITQARRVAPAMAEAALAEGLMLRTGPIARSMKLIDEAVAADPDNPDVLAYRSIALTNVGLMREALADSRRAVEANPLSPSARDALITALLNTDEIEAAKIELHRSEQLWPGATIVLQSRFAVEFRAGDPAKALQILKSGQLGAGYVSNAAHESYLRARIEPTARNKEIAIAEARSLLMRDPTASWVYERALAEFGSHEDLVDFLLRADPRLPYTTTWAIFRPSFSALHKDRRFMEIAKRFGVMDFWRDTGKWPDFCSRPDLPYDCKKEAAKLK